MGRRRKGDLPTYRRHASGQAFCVQNNQTYWLGKHGTPSSRSRFRRLLEKLDLQSPEPVPYDGFTLAELHRAWSTTKHERHTQSELDRFDLSLSAVTDLYPNTPVKEFGPKTLRRVRDAMLSVGLSPTTVNQRVGRIKRWLRWGVAEEFVPESVWRSCEALENLLTDTRKVRPVPDAIVEATIVFCTPNMAAMIRVHRLTGLRSDNVCGITADQIDRSDDIWVYWPSKHKTESRGKSLFVALRPSVRAIIEPLLADCEPDEPIFSPIKGSCRNDKRHTNRWTSDTYCHAVQRAIERAFKAECPMEWWHPHQLRHALGTEVREKEGAEASQTALGHANLATTEIYAEKSLLRAMDIARRLG